jgi:SNF2 family DNA or RNA helicase
MSDFDLKTWIPHGYQERGTDWLVSRPEAALFFPPGLGKTTTSLNAFLKLRSFGYEARLLVIAPLRVCQTTWQDEPKKWAQFADLKVGMAHGPGKEETLLDPWFDIVLLNYDGILWASKILAKQNPFRVVIFDELTKLKHTNTRRYKALKPILPKIQFRWGLTGTPVANGLLDLFGQIYCLDLGARFGAFITHFRLKYFYQQPWDAWGWYITPEKEAQIHRKLADIAMYIDPSEYLDLPELLDVDIKVELPPTIMEQYKKFEAVYIHQITEDKAIIASHAGVLSGKLRQFLGGALYDENHIPMQIHTAKLDALDELVDELAGEPLMVAYTFDHELENLKKRYPNALVFSGGMSEKTVKDNMLAWNTGTHPVMFVQPQAAAHGLNLQFGGNAICWYSLTYNLEDYIQLIKRIHRQGQIRTVRNYRLIVDKTLDSVLAKTLAEKDVTQEAVYTALLKLN